MSYYDLKNYINFKSSRISNIEKSAIYDQNSSYTTDVLIHKINNLSAIDSPKRSDVAEIEIIRVILAIRAKKEVDDREVGIKRFWAC